MAYVLIVDDAEVDRLMAENFVHKSGHETDLAVDGRDALEKMSKRLPDLVLVDGGRGHLGVVLDELKKLGLDDLPVIGIAKPVRPQRRFSRAGGGFERIYIKDRKNPMLLPKESKALHLLKKVRDEAHRFAISYHKKLMSKRIWKRS